MTPVDPATWPPALAVAILALAVHRVTRLLIADKISEPVRLRLAWATDGPRGDDGERQQRYRPWLGYLVTCPWCVSVYVAAAAGAAAAVLPWHWVAWPALVAALSSATGLLAGHESGDE